MTNRELVLALFSLSWVARVRVLRELNLTYGLDHTKLSDSELLREALRRAVEEGKIPALIEAVEKARIKD